MIISIEKLQKKLSATTENDKRIQLLVEIGLRSYEDQPWMVKKYARRVESLILYSSKELQKGWSLILSGKVEHYDARYTKALSSYTDAYEIMKKYGNICGQLEALLSKSITLYTVGEYQGSLSDLKKSSEIYEPHNLSDYKARALHATGIIYNRFSDYKTALDYFLEAVCLFKKRRKERKALAVLTCIPQIYIRLGNPEKALELSQQCLKEAQRIGSVYLESTVLGNIGVAYGEMRDSIKCAEYSFRALQIQKKLGDKKGQTTSFINISSALYEQGKYGPAFRYAKKALEYSRSMQNHTLLLNALTMIGQYCVESKRNTEALSYFHEVLDLSEDNTQLYLRGLALENLIKIYERTDDLKSAITYSKLYTATKVKHLEQQHHREIVKKQLQLEFERTENEREIYKLKTENLQLEIQRKKGEATSLAHQIIRKNELLGLLKTQIRGFNKSPQINKTSSLTAILTNIERAIDIGNTPREFEKALQELQGDFSNILLEQFPDLTKTECKVCSLMKSHFTSPQIASILCVSIRTVEVHRQHIRKKVHIPSDRKLLDFINEIH
jgi:tetratricopeptide (TPR) repeat protein